MELMAGRYDVHVRRRREGLFDVEVAGSGTRNLYAVSATTAMLEDLGVGTWPAEDVVAESFEFLLEREPPSSILATFDLRESI